MKSLFIKPKCVLVYAAGCEVGRAAHSDEAAQAEQAEAGASCQFRVIPQSGYRVGLILILHLCK